MTSPHAFPVPLRLPRFTGPRNGDKNSVPLLSTRRPTRPQHEAAFRQDAGRCWLNSGKPAHVVAAELGIMVEGRRGKQADGSAKTRQVYLGCVFTQHRCDEEGHPVRGWDSTT